MISRARRARGESDNADGFERSLQERRRLGMSSSAKTTPIDVVEAAYDLQAEPADWLPHVISAGTDVLDLGMGACAALIAGALSDGQPLITQMIPGTAGSRVLQGLMQTAQEVGNELIQQTAEAWARPGGINVVSEDREQWPRVVDSMSRNLGCRDVLGIWALDPDHKGVNVVIPSPEPIVLSSAERERWQMLAVHISAGNRLRRGLLPEPDVEAFPASQMPRQAEALLDPTRFTVAEAVGDAKSARALANLRESAVRIDKARGRLRKSDPAAALELWQGLVRGRWSLVDWFDTDGRRFVLAKPNAPNVRDPRELSEREAQVATYAALGESGKIIGYRFGISPQRVSVLLKSAMRKLGVKTQAQLVERMRGMPSEPDEN